MYKKALSAFFLKVHPDFFHFNETYQRTNENAVAQLNELLGWAKEFKKGACRPPPATKISFTFYRRLEEEQDDEGRSSRPRRASDQNAAVQEGLAAAASLRADGALQSSDGRLVTTLQSTFELPQNFKPQEANRGLVERSVNKFLRDLLRRAECIDSITESISTAEDHTLERLEERPLRRRSKGISLRDTSARRRGGGRHHEKKKEGESEEDESSAPKTLMDEAVEAFGPMYDASSPFYTPTPSLEELMEADQVFLSTSLSPLQSASALHTLRQHLGELNYYKWESMPVVIGDQFKVGGHPTSVQPPSSSRSAMETNDGTPSMESDPSLSGGFTIPWDFTPAQFNAFLQQQDAALRVARTQVEERAMAMEALIGELCHRLRWDDILISCSHVEAHQALLLLSRNEALLAAHGVTDLTVELGFRYATRANGVLILDAAHLTSGKSCPPPPSTDNCEETSQSVAALSPLQAWLRAVEPKLHFQKELYRVSKHLLETTMWYVKEVERVLEPGGIDAFDHNDCTYSERLQWVKELFRVSAGLARWDWSDFRFLLSPKAEKTTHHTSEEAALDEQEAPERIVDLDWDRKVMVLPFNFDGDAFLRYVEHIQEVTKERLRRSRIAAHEATRQQAAVQHAAAHDRELQLDGTGEGNEAAFDVNAGHEEGLPHDARPPGSEQSPSPIPSSPIPLDPVSALQGSAEDVLYSSERDLLHHGDHSGASPYAAPTNRSGYLSHATLDSSAAKQTKDRPPLPGYLEEYMTSTQTGSPDLLTVERPLQHAIHFNSDDEANDNLKWEGFYQEPYVDQVPTGDLDDLQHTFHLTNRQHREAAAKKLLEELQTTYGKKSRRFEYQKMGDVLEINNAKVQPKGFPILARGTRPAVGQ